MAASKEAAPGTLTAASFGVGGLFVVGALISMFIAAGTHDGVMTFHATLFILFFLLGIFAIGKRHFDAQENPLSKAAVFEGGNAETKALTWLKRMKAICA